MPELYLQRVGDKLETRFDGHTAVTLWSNITSLQVTANNAFTYGRDLFKLATQSGPLRDTLTHLSRNTRIVLIAEQDEVAAIPWEYMRFSDGTLLGAKHNLVRGVPEARQGKPFQLQSPLTIVAIPVSPVDDASVLNTDGEWRKLVKIVQGSEKTLTLRRVRPPTLGMMARALNVEGTNIVQFMGHSGLEDGKGVLAFENNYGERKLITAQQFVSELDEQTFLVVLNSCLSAVSQVDEHGQGKVSHLSNMAQAIIEEGIPYALGMQFVLLDHVALIITEMLYDFLLKGRGIEEAVRRTRAELERDTTLASWLKNANEQEQFVRWLAGIPVLYTNQRDPATALPLRTGTPTIDPNPDRFTPARGYDLNALPTPPHFIGRGEQISQALELLHTFEGGFLVLHGLGGIGKTALARTIAERVSYRYDDRVFAYSFETFTRFDGTGNDVVNEQFAETFYSTLASYYGLDARNYQVTRDLQHAILAQRRITRSLLVLDNMETLISKQKAGNEQAKALASFISRLKEDRNVVLLTSRDMPPADWGNAKQLHVVGLDDYSGAHLFLTALSQDRHRAATPDDAYALSHYVGGHPLSLRLLAGRFSDDKADTLATFLKNIEHEIPRATRKTSDGSQDEQRQHSIDACMDYSIRRLTNEQRKVLYTVGIFRAPFLREWAEQVLDDEEQTKKLLQDLVRLGLLEYSEKDFGEGYIEEYEMHPMLRQHIKAEIEHLDASIRERYGLVYENLARQAWKPVGGYDSSATIRHLILQSLPDYEAALKEEALLPTDRSSLAYHLAKPYERRGQIQQALSLYQAALATYQELGDTRSIAVTQHAMANVLVQQGKLAEAMQLYQTALATKEELGDTRNIAATQHAMANVLVQQGKLAEAMQLYQASLATYQELGDTREIAATQHAMANVLVQQGKLAEAMQLYQTALATAKGLGDTREIAVTQNAMADVLVRQGKLAEAMQLYQASLATYQELGDTREIAATQHAMAILLEQQGSIQEAIELYEESLSRYKELGALLDVAVSLTNYGDLLWDQGEHKRALAMVWEAYTSLSESDFLPDIERIKDFIVSFKNTFSGDEQQFDTLWQQATSAPQPAWLRDVQVGSSNNAPTEPD